MKIGIGNDHAAVDMKNQVVEYLEGKGYEVVNLEQIHTRAVIIQSTARKLDEL